MILWNHRVKVPTEAPRRLAQAIELALGHGERLRQAGGKRGPTTFRPAWRSWHSAEYERTGTTGPRAHCKICWAGMVMIGIQNGGIDPGFDLVPHMFDPEWTDTLLAVDDVRHGAWADAARDFYDPDGGTALADARYEAFARRMHSALGTTAFDLPPHADFNDWSTYEVFAHHMRETVLPILSAVELACHPDPRGPKARRNPHTIERGSRPCQPRTH